MNLRFKRCRALVTGGTRGIGEAVARALLAEGAEVIITGRSVRSGWWDAEEHCKLVVVDFSDSAQTKNFLSEMACMDVDLLVNNAASFHQVPVADFDISAWEEVIHTNLTIPMRITAALNRALSESENGRIVNVGSIAGIVSRSGLAAYSSSKAGLAGLTRAIALDYAGSGILVNCVCPAYTETDMLSSLSNQERADLLMSVPLGRFATPGEVAAAVLFLLSPNNTFITGQTLVIDGGVTLR